MYTHIKSGLSLGWFIFRLSLVTLCLFKICRYIVEKRGSISIQLTSSQDMIQLVVLFIHLGELGLQKSHMPWAELHPQRMWIHDTYHSSITGRN